MVSQGLLAGAAGYGCHMNPSRNVTHLTILPVLAQGGDRIEFSLGSILVYVLIGLVIGVIARVVIPGSAPMGILGTILIGIVGAIAGGYLAGAVFEETPGVDWIASILVAALLVWLLSRFGRGTVR
jgi:uncharacterized membrane protein YeaQ/YmgE (transglycosylase-associated protein family)